MIKDFVGGDIGRARPAFSHKQLHLFPQPRELFPGHPDRARPDVQAKTRELFEAELAKLN
jgi:hypothetical protein